MKLIYTKSRLFQKLSLSELEMLHHLCELGRTQTSQSVALAILKIPYAGYLLSGNRSNFIDCEGNVLLNYVLVNCTHRVISDKVHRLLVTLSYFRPDRLVKLHSLKLILILLLYRLVSLNLVNTGLCELVARRKATVF